METRHALMQELVRLQSTRDHQDILTITAFMDDRELATHVARYRPLPAWPTTNVIILFHTSKGWMAQHRGPHAAEIESLFGTAYLPTAFAAGANPDMVQREIAALNPTCEVLLTR